jgi:peptidoglycan/LPS O-acetylase OafA/YrhL
MLALFPVGAALAEGFNRGWIDAIPRAVAFVLVAIGCLVPALLPFSVWGLIASSSLTLGCIAIPRMRAWLSGKVSARLGKISFPLFLMHGPVLCFIGEPVMRHSGHGMALKILIDLGVVLLSFAAAFAFLPVNEFAISAAHRFATWIMRPFAVSPTPAER